MFKKRLIIIPDIHADLNALDTTLVQSGCAKRANEEIVLLDTHQLLFTGDLIDRGPNGLGVLDRMYQLLQETDTTILAGNHDLLMWEALLHPDNMDNRIFWTDTRVGGLAILEEINRKYPETATGGSAHQKAYDLLQKKFNDTYHHIFNAMKLAYSIHHRMIATHAIIGTAYSEKTVDEINNEFDKRKKEHNIYEVANVENDADISEIVWKRTMSYEDSVVVHRKYDAILCGHNPQEDGCQNTLRTGNVTVINGDIGMSTGIHCTSKQRWGYISIETNGDIWGHTSESRQPIALGNVTSSGYEASENTDA